MPGTIVYVQAGTPAQQTLIQGAHAAALAACQAAQAGTGQPSFATWFGSAPAAAVSAKLAVAVNALQTTSFAYDLEDRLLPADTAPGCALLMTQDTPTAIDVSISSPLLEDAEVEAGEATARLARSIVHEILRLTDATLMDFVGTFNDASAQLFASLDSANGVVSLQNYVGFVASFMTGLRVRRQTRAALAAEPQMLQTQVLDSDGNVTALRSTNFGNVQFGPDGRITGGSYEIDSMTPAGVTTIQSTVQVASGGLPTTIAATKYDNGAPSRYINADYSDLQFSSDTRIIGGQISSASTNPGDGSQSNSTLTFSEAGNLSTVTAVRTAPGAATTTAATDYKGVTFDSDHKPVSGTAITTVTLADGTLRTRTSTTFAGDLGMAIYTERFANDGTTTRENTVSVRRDGTLAITGWITYKFGERQKGTAVSFAPNGKTVTAIAKTDYSQATFSPAHKQIDGTAITVVTRPDGSMASRATSVVDQGWTTTTTETFAADGTTLQTVAATTQRSDNTVAVQRVMTFDPSGLLQTATRRSYDVDGITLLVSTTTDFTAATLDQQGNILGGQVSTAQLRPDGSVKTRTTINYA